MGTLRIGCDVCNFPVDIDSDQLGDECTCSMCKTSFTLNRNLELPPEGSENDSQVEQNSAGQFFGYLKLGFWGAVSIASLCWLCSHFFYIPKDAALRLARNTTNARNYSSYSSNSNKPSTNSYRQNIPTAANRPKTTSSQSTVNPFTQNKVNSPSPNRNYSYKDPNEELRNSFEESQKQHQEEMNNQIKKMHEDSRKRMEEMQKQSERMRQMMTPPNIPRPTPMMPPNIPQPPNIPRPNIPRPNIPGAP